MSEHAADIVLSYYDERNVVAEQLEGFEATYIPVARNGEFDGLQSGSVEARLTSTDSVKTFLKAIHRSLRASKA